MWSCTKWPKLRLPASLDTLSMSGRMSRVIAMAATASVKTTSRSAASRSGASRRARSAWSGGLIDHGCGYHGWATSQLESSAHEVGVSQTLDPPSAAR